MENLTSREKGKGLTVISEVVLAIGIIVVSVVFALVAANVIQFESEGVVQSSQKDIAGDLESLLNSMRGFNGTTTATYNPELDQYNLSILANGTIKAYIPGRSFGATASNTLDLEETCISNAKRLEIEKTDRKVNITARGPRTVQWSPENDTCRKNRPKPGDIGEPGINFTGERPEFKIAYVPLKYSSEDEQVFKNYARQAHRRFLRVSPFNTCEQPKSHLEVQIIEPGDTEDCSIETCDASFEGDCFDKIEKCAASALNNDEWNLAVGICDNREDGCGKDSGNLDLCGRGAGVGEKSSVVFYPNTCPSSAVVAPHMIGHSLGLYGIQPQNPSSSCKKHRRSCRSPNAPDCSEPDAETYVMSFCDNDQRYGPAATKFLREKALNRYLWGNC